MNKKLSSALLFGALLMASTSVFVSCKDYDDDVKDLQTQINNLTSAVGQKETTINTSIVNLRTAITALEAMEEAYKKADAAVLAEAKDAVAKAEAALKAAYESGDAATLNAAKAALAEAEAALQAAYQSADAEVLAAAQQAVADAKATLQGEMKAADAATLNAALDAMTEAKTSLMAEIEAANAATLAAAKEAVNQAKTALEAAINANYETLVAKDAELSAAILSAQTAVDQAMTLLGTKADKTELASVNNELQNTIQSLNTLNSTVSGAVTDIKSLQTALAAQESALKAQESALSQTNEQMAAALEQINTLQTTLAEQEAALRKAIADETARINAEFESMGITIAELREAHETFALRTEVATVQSKVNGINKQVEDIASEIAAIDAKYDVITAMLAKALRSLVYMPELYMDGIETIEYPYLRDTTLTQSNTYSYTRSNDGKTIKLLTDWRWPSSYQRGNSDEKRDNVFLFGPAWDVYYHMNPSKANPKYADVQGFYAYQVETVTRAIPGNKAAEFKISSPEKYANGDQLFKAQNGILTAGLQVNLKYRNAFESNAEKVFVNEKNGSKNIIVGLQVKSVLDNATTSTDTLITSDYAMLYPEKVWLEGIVWLNTTPKQKDNEYIVNVPNPVNKDEACTINGAKVHVWNTPEEALEHNGDNADVKLYWDGQSGLDLANYLGVHYVRESLTSKAANPGTWAFNSSEMLHYGLKVKFDKIDYQVDTNETRDSRFVKITDADTKGNIKAQNVDAAGNEISGDRIATVGREPLVRVRVYLDQPNWGVDKPILDGYILVKIVRNNPATPENIIVVDKYPVEKKDFDFCNGKTIWNTNWSQFHSYVLDQTLNLDKDRFDAQYEPDLKVGATPTEFNLYKKSGNTYVASTYGKAIYVENTADMTNHRYYLDITATEFENLTHDKSLPFEDELYIRYSKKAGSAAEYDYVYVKIPVKLGRNAIEEGSISGKNTNYWYRIDGNDEGLDGIALNVFEPFDNEYANVFSRPITHTFTTNKVSLGAGNQYKFFFLPVEYTIKALNGKVYTVTPKKNANDETWNAMVCLYDLHPAKYTTHKFKTKQVTENGKTFFKADDDANKETLQNCVIDWNDGVYNNTTLYAVYNNTYTPIATLTNVSADGTIELQHNDAAHDVLNAIGFDENKGNFNDQLRSFVCVVSRNSSNCGYAYHTKDASFVASWERPINVDEHYTKPFIDAETNGNYLYAVDFLHLYDWRGWPIDAQGNQVHYGDRGTTSIINYRGDMENEHKWYWAYYGINKITIDCRPSNVMTNMHQTNKNNFVKLSNVTTKAELYAVDATGNAVQNATCSFNLSSYNKVSQNAALLAYMEGNKQLFGGIFYKNNGDNVEDFKVRIPVTIGYFWGDFPTTVEIEIKRSIGQ